ncbi:MAG: hypothetical protein IPH39_04060 [Sulfuritalea sp.]|nr:hypothetical protein [Sulfuritalea sp.]
MKTSFLEFEQPIAELEAKIEQLRFVQDDSAVDISEEISRLDAKSQSLTKEIYAKLTPWQCAWRHGILSACIRSTMSILYFRIFRNFAATVLTRTITPLLVGPARFNGQSRMVIGHQKGRDTKEKDPPEFRHATSWKATARR